MTYATQADIEARYPGELAQAGPRDGDGDLDTAAIALACGWASAVVDRYLAVIAWIMPDPVPGWVTDLTVDLALYQATPTVLASQADFADRLIRYRAALAQLEAIASGKLLPGATGLREVYTVSRPRLFERGVL